MSCKVNRNAGLSSRRISGPQIEIALRLQLSDAHDAALLGADEAGQEVSKADLLGSHGVAAGGKLKSCLGKPADMLGEVGGSLRGLKCPQRRAVDDQRNRDVVGPANAVKMVLDVAN